MTSFAEMKPLLAFFAMIGAGAFLTFVGSNRAARLFTWKVNLVHLLSRNKRPSLADDLSLTVVPLMMGFFLLGTGLVLLVVYLVRWNAI